MSQSTSVDSLLFKLGVGDTDVDDDDNNSMDGVTSNDSNQIDSQRESSSKTTSTDKMDNTAAAGRR